MRRFVVPDLAVGPVTLDPAESHHLLHVLRAKRGASVGLTDGRGGTAEGLLVDGRGGVAVVRVDAVRHEAPGHPRTILLGWPKAPLAEEAVQLGTEAGATTFIGVRAARSPLPAPRRNRLDKVMDAAVIQSGRATRPHLLCFETLAEAVESLGEGLRFIGEPGAPPLSGVDGSVILAIGPEGGWSDDERAHLFAAGFVPAGLGAHILRAPTAVAVGLGALGAVPR